MNAVAFEAFLARLYTAEDARARFLADPRGEAVRAGLTEAQGRTLEQIDRVGLTLAAHSAARKRAQHALHQRESLLARILRRQWF